MDQQSAIATLLLAAFGIAFLSIGVFIIFQMNTVAAGYGRQRVAFVALASVVFGLTFFYVAYDR